MLPSLTPVWEWCNWELSEVQAPGAGVTMQAPGTRRGGMLWDTHRMNWASSQACTRRWGR